MSSSTIAVAVNFAASVVVPLKSNAGLAIAALPSACSRKSTCASSWSRTVVANVSSSPESAPPATAWT